MKLKKGRRDIFLLENHCYFAQGYFYSRPLPRAEYEELLRSSAPWPPKAV